MKTPTSAAGLTVLIPARLGSTRLPNKPLADIAGQPMVVRVAQRAAASQARAVVVATDSEAVLRACEQYGVAALLTRADHASGSDRLAEACDLLGLADDALVVNLQGDEPLMEPSLIDAVAHCLQQRTDCVMSTAAHPINGLDEFLNPNVVKVVTDRQHTALCFSRAPIPWWRDASPSPALPCPAPWRHIGLYAYRAGFLRLFPTLASSPWESTESLEQLRVLWHGERIAVHLTQQAPGAGVDTLEDLQRVRQLWAERS